MPGNIPYYFTPVPTGFPSPAADYREDLIDLTKELIKHPLSTFIIESEGTSMIDAFIPPKAKLLIDRSITAKNGDIILAVVNGEFTVKYLKKSDYKCWLVPANKKYKEIEITPDMDFTVWGVIISIIVNPNDIKCLL
jgi:DNA polymerase V